MRSEDSSPVPGGLSVLSDLKTARRGVVCLEKSNKFHPAACIFLGELVIAAQIGLHVCRRLTSRQQDQPPYGAVTVLPMLLFRCACGFVRQYR